MRIYLYTIIVGLVSFLMFSSKTPVNFVFAQDQTILSAEGPVVLVDNVNNTVTLNITVNDIPSEKVFSTDADTVISEGEELILFSDIQTGQEVNVTYSVNVEGSNIATFIAVN